MASKVVMADEPVTFTGSVMHVGNVAFYGVTPPAQRSTTSVQLSSNLSTVATASSTAVGTALNAAINANQAALQEVMATLKAHGLWATN
jgi:hypothetical protein